MSTHLSTIIDSDDARGQAALRWSRIVELMTICGRSLKDQLAERAASHGVSQPQFFILLACDQAPAKGLGQNDLVARLARSAAHTSVLVEQLRAAGLIVGRRSLADRRRQLWRLSASGEALLANMLADLKQWAAGLEANLQQSQREILVAALETLAEAPRLSTAERSTTGQDSARRSHTVGRKRA